LLEMSYVKVLDKVSLAKPSIFSKVDNLENGWEKELVELWQYNVVEEKPELFDPPGLVHVCQGSRGYDASVKGNCHKYHLDIGETPCTPHETCRLRDEFRDAQDFETRKMDRLEKIRKKISEKEKARVKRYNDERKEFEELKWGVY